MICEIFNPRNDLDVRIDPKPFFHKNTALALFVLALICAAGACFSYFSCQERAITSLFMISSGISFIGGSILLVLLFKNSAFQRK